MDRQVDIDLQDKISKDMFFLNIEDAYSEAVKQNKIVDEKGGEHLQYCYYDGPLTDIVLDNFIQVSSDSFVEFFSHNHLPIPQIIAISQNGVVHFNEMPADVVEEINIKRRERADIIKKIKDQLSDKKLSDFLDRDVYFVDPLLALNEAKQKNRVYCGHPTIDGLQVCYYRGELPLHGIENLVHVELTDLVDFFIVSRLRLPEKVEVPNDLEEELKAAVQEDFANALDAIQKKRQTFALQLAQKAKALKLGVVKGERIRVFIPSNRLTTVMQYSSQGVAKAFEKRDCQVLFYIESNDMETGNVVDMLNKYIDFNPHVTFNVNNLNNAYLHDEVVNIIWWQDPMPQIKKQQLLNWRKNDFNFSMSPIFDQYLKLCGAEIVERQHFAIDEEIFYSADEQLRQQKVIFVGSSYLPAVDLTNNQQLQVIAELVEILNRGGRFDEQTVTSIADRSPFNYEFVYWKLLHYVIRDYSVKWLCQNSSLPVEIYGRYWDQDPLVAPFYQGELQHGVEVADAYRSATYAIVSHPFEINSQRLAEVAACGCIPVVYDCRDVAEKPHWDDFCLFFKTESDLINILNTQAEPLNNPTDMAQYFTYKKAVDNFIEHSGIKRLMIEKNSDFFDKPESGLPKNTSDLIADIYFTDINRAMAEAQKQNKIIDDSGKERLQYCYYDGELTDSVLVNLIKVPQTEFTEFFVYNDLPIPTWVITANGDALDLTQNSAMIDEIINMRKTNKAAVNHCDTDFFDVREALNVAKQKNIYLSEEGDKVLQICYYHGEVIDCELENLVHVDLDNMVEFFIHTRMRFPEILRADPSLKADYENVFSIIAEQKQQIIDSLKQEAQLIATDFYNDRPVRVMILANDINSKLLSFENILNGQGFDIQVYIENDAMHVFNAIDFLTRYIDYKPNILIQENHLFSDFLHQDIINAVYWHDDASKLEVLSTLTFRTNDFNISSSPTVYKHLKRCGAKNIYNDEYYNLSNFISTLCCFTEEKQELFVSSLLEYPIVLRSQEQGVIEQCTKTFSSNIDNLSDTNRALFEKVSLFLSNNSIDLLIDDEINGEFCSLSVAINGVSIYSLDLKGLGRNKYLISKNTEKYKGRDAYAYCLNGMGCGYELLLILSATDMPVKELPNMEIPVYVVERNISFLVASMVANNLQPIFSSKRVQFFFGEDALSAFENELLNLQSIIPVCFIDNGFENAPILQLHETIRCAKEKKSKKHQDNVEKISNYYNAISEKQWIEKYSPNNRSSLKVMGITTLFTSFLQYCIRDLIDGFSRLGIESIICIENENYERISIEKIISDINTFRPDLIVIIDHFRHGFPGIPESVPFVNWIQDMLPNITGNKRTMKARDFTFVFAKYWLGLNELPIYKHSPVEFLPLGYNDKIYFPIDEEKNYDCDVLVVTHLQEPERTFDPIRNPEQFQLALNDNESKLIEAGIISKVELIGLYQILDEHLSSLNMSEFNKFCIMRGANSIHDISVITVSEFNAVFYKNNITLEASVMEVLFPLTGNRLHCEYLSKIKTWPVSLLIDSHTNINIHLYGKNWNRYPKFKKFARGTADNGEYLNKIMNNARICLNVSPGITLHMRALEIMGSCSFMLSRRNEFDGSPLSDYFSDEQVILYDDEDDFLNKVRFYLENEFERNRVSQNALSRVQEMFTYKAIAENMHSSLSMRLFK